MSDHQMIITTINARRKIIRNKPRKVYLYKKGNLDAVKEYLDSKLESFKEKYKEINIEGYWTTFKSHLFNAMDQYIPSKTLTSRWNIPWINQNIKKMIRKKERLYKAAKRYQTEDHWKRFKQYRAQVKAEIDKARRKFIFDMLEVNGTTSNNTTTNQIGKKYWKYVKSRKRETVGGINTEGK